MPNRMRNLLKLINDRFGKEALAILRKYEGLNIKICDYKNHWRFSLRCMSNDLVPVSLKLKNIVWTYKSDCIIHRAERSLLNERIRSINNTLEKLEHGRYKNELKLSAIIEPDLMKNCTGIIDLKETRCRKVLEWQRLKFERLKIKNTLKQHSSNSGNNYLKMVTHTRSRHHLCQTSVGLLLYLTPPIWDTRNIVSTWDQISL